MATYKKRGAKKSISSSKENDIAVESTTAEVFEALDSFNHHRCSCHWCFRVFRV